MSKCEYVKSKNLLTKPMPGLRARLKRLFGISDRRGIRESSSFHRTVKAGSDIALHVRDNLETERRPLGVSRIYSKTNLDTSGSLRSCNMMTGVMEVEHGKCRFFYLRKPFQS